MKSNRHGCAAMIAVCLATLGLADLTSLVAQDVYPSRAISIVVPYTSGGGVDSVARLVAEAFVRTLASRLSWTMCLGPAA
jgi:tripartite-type tricarboxylate transporter receptor subunit TctC